MTSTTRSGEPAFELTARKGDGDAARAYASGVKTRPYGTPDEVSGWTGILWTVEADAASSRARESAGNLLPSGPDHHRLRRGLLVAAGLVAGLVVILAEPGASWRPLGLGVLWLLAGAGLVVVGSRR